MVWNVLPRPMPSVLRCRTVMHKHICTTAVCLLGACALAAAAACRRCYIAVLNSRPLVQSGGICSSTQYTLLMLGSNGTCQYKAIHQGE